MARRPKKRELATIGWREWVALPDLGVSYIKAKIDTGARSSALHAFDLEEFQQDGKEMLRFKIHPRQRSSIETVSAAAELLEHRRVRSSGGHVTRRPVILTPVQLLGRQFPIELTLASRDEMGFRMLLGREAIRPDFLVDAGRSYYGGKPPWAVRSRKTKRTEKSERSER